MPSELKKTKPYAQCPIQGKKSGPKEAVSAAKKKKKKPASRIRRSAKRRLNLDLASPPPGTDIVDDNSSPAAAKTPASKNSATNKQARKQVLPKVVLQLPSSAKKYAEKAKEAADEVLRLQGYQEKISRSNWDEHDAKVKLYLVSRCLDHAALLTLFTLASQKLDYTEQLLLANQFQHLAKSQLLDKIQGARDKQRDAQRQVEQLEAEYGGCFSQDSIVLRYGVGADSAVASEGEPGDIIHGHMPTTSKICPPICPETIGAAASAPAPVPAVSNANLEDEPSPSVPRVPRDIIYGHIPMPRKVCPEDSVTAASAPAPGQTVIEDTSEDGSSQTDSDFVPTPERRVQTAPDLPNKPCEDEFRALSHYIRGKGKSGYKGVSFDPWIDGPRTALKKRRQPWRVKHANATLGRFKTKAEACQAYYDKCNESEILSIWNDN